MLLLLWFVPFQAFAQDSIRAQPAQGSFGDIACGSEGKILRDRATRLREAAQACRDDIAAGHPACLVRISWANKIAVSPASAELLATRLIELAAHVNDVDASLDYDVHQSQTTYHQPLIRCSVVGTQALSVYQRCRLNCTHRAASMYYELIRGESGEDLLVRLTAVNFGYGMCLKKC